ncbi:hypothetical protein DV532_16855 [Pseudomonas sp. Leaf58]|nr:hypothetical protein DV532_16855 [Pseudomonas sp. Leaf58]
MSFLGLVFPAPASSRVNPLPQDRHGGSGLCSTCGSGFTREAVGTDDIDFSMGLIGIFTQTNVSI